MVGNDDLGKEPPPDTPKAPETPSRPSEPAFDESTAAATGADAAHTAQGASTQGASEQPGATSSGLGSVTERSPVERPTQEGAEQQAQSAPQDEQAEPAAPEPDWKEQYEKARNQLLRVAADFENYKKRAKRDSQDAAHRARDEVLQEFLPVIDNLERALGHAEASEVQDAASLVAGVQMVLRSFQAGMERFGLKGFDSLGQVFDPNLHEALSLRESSDVTPGSVLEEFRRGYHLGERLIRPALVVVAKAPAAAAAESPDAGEPSKSPVDESVRASSDTPAPAPSTGGDEAPANEPPAGNQGGGSLEEGRQA